MAHAFVLLLMFVGTGNCVLEDGILEDLQNLALQIYKNPICLLNDVVTEADVTQLKYNLYNRNRSQIPIALTSLTFMEIQPALPTFVMIQGWIEDLKINPWPLEMIDAYLTKYADANFIHVDWTEYSQKRLLTSACSAPAVGEAIGTFMSNLIRANSLDSSTTHVLGFSLGAQVAGFVGQRVQNLTGFKLGKITGMDARGPDFENQPADKRLSVGDAVDVIGLHTNVGGRGTKAPFGRVDFYANNGIVQPQCLVPNIPELLRITDVLQFIKIFFCSHFKAPTYKINSILDETKYVAYKCNSPVDWSLGLCKSGARLAFKENVDPTATGTYYFSAFD